MSLTLLQQDTFTSDGTNEIINLPGGADYFTVLNETEGAATNNRQFKYEWNPNLNAGEAFVWNKTGGGNGVEFDLITTGGLTYREAYPSPEAPKTGTTITAASPAVCSCVAHGYSVGDKVRIYSNVAMKQIGGMSFTITAVGGANEFTLGYLDSSGFAAAETGFLVRRIAPELKSLPGAEFITAITQAASGVVTFSEAHNYKIGDVLYFRCPSDFGMVEIDGLQGKVTAVATSTVTVDINTSAFTAFAFPASAISLKFALAGLAGKRGLYDDWFADDRSLLDLDPFRSGLKFPYMFLPAGTASPAGSSGDVITWQAFRKGN